MAYEIYTYDYGDMMQNILNAVAAIVSSDNYVGLVASAATIYLVYKMLQAVFGREGDFLSIMKNLTILVAVISALTQIKSTVIVNDRVSPSKTGVVSNVPWAIAFPLWISSRLEYILTNTFETALSVPSEVSYNNVGLAGGVKNIRDASLYIEVADPYLRQSIVQFYKDCVFTAILDGLINSAQVTKDKVVNVISAAGSLEPARPTVIYSSSNPAGTTTTCEDASTEILNRISTDKDNAFSSLAQAMGYSETTLATLLGGEFAFYMGISDNAKDTVYQEALLTISKDALISKAAEAGIDPNQLGLTIATAKEKMFLSNVSAGEQVKELLPEIRAILVMLASLSTPIILAIGLAVGRPIKYAATAFAIFFFPVLWGMLDAFVNFYINSRLTELKGLVATTSYSTATINVVNYPLIHLKLKDNLAAAGLLATMIPVISVMIASGSAYAFVKVAGGITSSIVGSSSGAAASTATGNLSYGNASIGNKSYNNFSAENRSLNNFNANRWDSTAAFLNGQQIRQVDEISNLFSRVKKYTIDYSAEITTPAGKIAPQPFSAVYNQGEGNQNAIEAGQQYRYGETGARNKNAGENEQSTENFNLRTQTTNSKALSKDKRVTDSAGVTKEGHKREEGSHSFSTGYLLRWLYGNKYSTSVTDSEESTTQSITRLALNGNLPAGKGGRIGGGGGTGGSGTGQSKVKSALSSLLPQANAGLGIQGLNSHSEGQKQSENFSLETSGTQDESFNELLNWVEGFGYSERGQTGETYQESDGLTQNTSVSNVASVDKQTSKGRYSNKGYQATEDAAIQENATNKEAYYDNKGFTFQRPLPSFITEDVAKDPRMQELARTEIAEALKFRTFGIPEHLLNRIPGNMLVYMATQAGEQVSAIAKFLSPYQPRVPSSYERIKNNTSELLEKFKNRANQNVFNGELAGRTQEQIENSEQRIEAEGKNIEEQGQTIREQAEGQINRATEQQERTKGKIEGSKAGLEGKIQQNLDKVLSRFEQGIPDKAEFGKALEALMNNDSFKALAAYAGVRKASDLFRFAENLVNKGGLREAVKRGLGALGRLGKEAFRIAKSSYGAVVAGLLAEMAILKHMQDSYTQEKAEKIERALEEGKVKGIHSLDELKNGQVGAFTTGGYTFLVLKEPPKYVTPENAVLGSYGADVSSYTIFAVSQDGKNRAFFAGLDRVAAEHLIKEGKVPFVYISSTGTIRFGGGRELPDFKEGTGIVPVGDRVFAGAEKLEKLYNQADRS